MFGPRRLLARLRALMASGAAAPLDPLVKLVAGEMVAEVCSIYVMRPGAILELAATEGLRPEAVHHTRLRVGEGIVGVAASTGEVLNLPDAQNHPAFVYRPETGEESYSSLIAVPIRRSGHTLGVLTVQNRTPRRYDEEEVEVLETIAMLVAELLAASGVKDGDDEAVGVTGSRVFDAVVLAPGLAMGPVHVLGTTHAPKRLLADDPQAELRRLDAATEKMRRGLDVLIEQQAPDGEAPREILEAYRVIASDPGFLRRIGEAVKAGLTAEAAVWRVAGEVRERMRRISDPYLRERLADMEDLAARLATALTGDTGPETIPPGTILVARRLGPAQLLDWYGRGIAGVVIEEGSPSGHAAIMARALDIPTLGGARGLLESADAGDEAVLDAEEGQFILRPEPDLRLGYEHAMDARRERQAGFAALRDVPSLSRDGERVRLMINIGLAMELDQLDRTGAEGIGLFRTEIAMLARGGVADVAEQAAIYSRVLDAAGDRPVIFRTLDLGGDKLLPDAPPPEEENPAMGWRSLRVALDRPVLLRRQLRALLLAAAGRKLSVMFPMVATIAEFRQARAVLTAEAARVRPGPSEISIGTMLEVPALLFQIPALLRECDFISVGTNDLMQFFFAADRGSPALAGRYDLLSAPVLDALGGLATLAGAAGVPVSVCGEAASRPLEALVLASLGYETLSMPAPSVLPVKAALLGTDLGALRTMLTSLRRSGVEEASLREPLLAWLREQGAPI